MSINLVIFDMDGVLIDSENLWQQAEQELFREIGISIDDDLLAQTRGLPSGEMVDHWCRRFRVSNIAPETLLQRYDQRMMEVLRNAVPLMEGAKEAIHFFRSKGLPLALASCSAMNQIEAAMDRHQLREYFELMVSVSDGMPGKPHPEIYLQTAKKMGVDPMQCLAIEDSFYGLISAKAAKMKVISMPDPEEYEQDRFGAADAKIRSLTEINETLFNRIQNL